MIYLDNAATTKPFKEVAEVVQEFTLSNYGNASSLYSLGQKSREVIEKSREILANFINAKPEEIIFTSCGSETNNTAIFGIVRALWNKGDHIITSSIEHHSVLECCYQLEKDGYEVTFLPVDKYGIIDLDELEESITDRTVLISIMTANNEVGTIEPIEKIAKIAIENDVIFHTDAVQAIGSIPIDVQKLGVHLLSLSGHKFHAPKGVGALYVKSGTMIPPFIFGGGQEKKRRAGTENVAAIAGLGKAIEILSNIFEEKAYRITSLKEKLIKGLFSRIDNILLNGHPTERLPGNVNVSFKYAEGESILLALNAKEIYVSTGSACTTGALEPSHVLLALGVAPEIAHGSVRFSIGTFNTEEEIEYVLEVLPEIISKLRAMSPIGVGAINRI